MVFILMFKALLLIIVALALSSCAVGPDYHPLSPSELKVPQQWHGRVAHNGSNQKLLNWWAQFHDPVLSKLIQAAIATNPSLLESLARIKQAKAMVGSSSAKFYPSLTLSPSMTLSNSGNATINIDGSTTPLLDGIGSGVTSSYRASIDSTWEIDLFGATRRSVEAAEARLQKSQLAWNDARVSLVADVADNYVQYRVCQALSTTYQEQLKSNTETSRITNLKINYGRSSAGDGKQAAAAYYSAQASIEQQHGECAKLENKLISLTGLDFLAIESQLQITPGTTSKIPLPPVLQIASIPAAVIAQRPDIAMAECEVVAANAEIGSAQANRYPKLTLTGLIALTSPAGGASPLTWSFNPSLLFPLFKGGELAAQVKLKEAQYLEAVAKYKAKVLNAVNEIEDDLATINAANQQNLAQVQAAKNYNAYFAIMNHKYQLGSSGILDLELARGNMLNAQTALYNVQLAQVRAWIALYKATGGSWDR